MALALPFDQRVERINLSETKLTTSIFRYGLDTLPRH